MLSVCLTFSSLAQAQVSSQFELSGSEAKTIYKALKDETYWAVDKQKGYASIEVLDCTTASGGYCITYSHDGDPKTLKSRAEFFQALKSAGYNFKKMITGLSCTKSREESSPQYKCIGRLGADSAI